MLAARHVCVVWCRDSASGAVRLDVSGPELGSRLCRLLDMVAQAFATSYAQPITSSSSSSHPWACHHETSRRAMMAVGPLPPAADAAPSCPPHPLAHQQGEQSSSWQHSSSSSSRWAPPGPWLAAGPACDAASFPPPFSLPHCPHAGAGPPLVVVEEQVLSSLRSDLTVLAEQAVARAQHCLAQALASTCAAATATTARTAAAGSMAAVRDQ